MECRGRIQGDYPVYQPDSEMYTEMLVQHAHEASLHGGVVLTMAKVLETHWVPRLHQLVKCLIKCCYECKRFHAVAYCNLPPGNLPQDHTVGTMPFQVIRVHYAGPVKYCVSRNREGKAYIVLHVCSLNRALYLKLTKIMETEEFISTLKRFIVRKGCPEKSYLDNGRTFMGAAKWMQNAMQDEQLHKFPCQAEHQEALQTHQSTMVHWAVRENDWSCQASVQQKHWKRNSHLGPVSQSSR